MLGLGDAGVAAIAAAAGAVLVKLIDAWAVRRVPAPESDPVSVDRSLLVRAVRVLEEMLEHLRRIAAHTEDMRDRARRTAELQEDAVGQGHERKHLLADIAASLRGLGAPIQALLAELRSRITQGGRDRPQR